MVGRGFRLSPGKTDCLVLDFGGNVKRHGPVDRILVTEKKLQNGDAPVKECPNCQEVVPIACAVCPDCGAKFEESEMGREIKHESSSAESNILSEPEEVKGVQYIKHQKKGTIPGQHPATLRVIYSLEYTEVSEFVCFEHRDYARNKAIGWWKARSSEPVPLTVDGALNQIQQTGIKEPKKLVLATDGKYMRVQQALELTPAKPVFQNNQEIDVPF
jgi:DNA repair protein RadD